MKNRGEVGMTYRGNGRRRLSEDGSYHLRRCGDDWVAEITYRWDYREVALLSTRDHSDLMDIVLDGQVDMRGVPGGRFLINEKIKELRGVRRFMQRGREACRTEWRLHAATHNLRKLWSSENRRLPFDSLSHRPLLGSPQRTFERQALR